jgi:hypothetical protein
MKDLNGRIKQLTSLILTSQTVDESKGDESRPASPVKVDFDMSPYQVHMQSFRFLLVGRYSARLPSYTKSSSLRVVNSNLKRPKYFRSKPHSKPVPHSL